MMPVNEETVMIPVNDKTLIRKEGIGVIYFSGGCFWCLEKYMRAIPGVIKVTSGYANGLQNIKPDFKRVNTGVTGYQDAVRVEYDQTKISLEAILFAYFRIIDPTIENRQGKYKGTQYQAGIYYSDRASGKKVLLVADVERLRHTDFNVETAPLTSFYDAEEEHQQYLAKHPEKKCDLSQNLFDMVSNMIVDPANFPHLGATKLKKRLTEKQYSVTQNNDTETPFDNPYWDKFEKGIYVDVVTGEPLFSSTDKYKSSYGWPAFSKVIDENSIIYTLFSYQGKSWVGLNSRTGNSHLGRVSYDDPESPTGNRYSINSASLKFIPYDKMEKKGYGFLMERVK